MTARQGEPSAATLTESSLWKSGIVHNEYSKTRSGHERGHCHTCRTGWQVFYSLVTGAMRTHGISTYSLHHGRVHAAGQFHVPVNSRHVFSTYYAKREISLRNRHSHIRPAAKDNHIGSEQIAVELRVHAAPMSNSLPCCRTLPTSALIPTSHQRRCCPSRLRVWSQPGQPLRPCWYAQRCLIGQPRAAATTRTIFKGRHQQSDRYHDSPPVF